MTRPRNLTLAQALVGGYVGFGLLVGILCFSIGTGWRFWLAMTTLLTVVYTVYYYLTTKPVSQDTTGSSE